MTREEFLTRFPNATPSTLRANGYSVDPVAPNVRERGPDQPLVKSPRPQRRRKGRVEVICSIVRCGPGCLDSDNTTSGGNKALRDAIAESLGYDDGDARIRFQYGQCETLGETGCIVRIECL